MAQDQAPYDLPEVDQITSGFETQWKSGPRPRVAEFVSFASGAARRSVLVKLIGLDVDYRRRAGENPSVDDYKLEFSELSPAELDGVVSGTRPRDTMTTQGIVPVTFDVPPSLRTSKRFNKIEEIGRGGMGSVWRATQMSTGREVALKELPAKALGSPAARSRFEEEIHWASQLQNPHIARVYDSGLLEGSYVYAMELIHGEHLDEYGRKNQYTLRQMLEMMSTIAKAVQYAHERNVLHLDLKPSNIMVTPEGKPIIVDFGLARFVRKATTGENGPRYGDVMGTPAYMAPEQALGRDDLIGRPTDVYSLGVMIYNFITGAFPHARADGVGSSRQKVVEERIRSVREIKPGISKDVEALTMKCLAPNPADRYSDAGQLGSDIDCLLQGLELQVRPLSWIGKAKSWCCRPARLLQAGNLSIVIGAILAPFHIIGTCLAIARSLGAPVPGFEHLRLREFLLLMAGFMVFDAWLLFSGSMVRRNRIWALYANMAVVVGWLSWFILVLSGAVRFDTGGAVNSMAVRLPVYMVFSGFAVIGLAVQCLAISAHYARAFLDEPLPTSLPPK